MTLGARLDAWLGDLFRPVDAASLVFFRVAFGAIMLVECWRFWAHGWIGRHYVQPDFFFTYYGFGWVHPWPGDGMYWHFAGLAVLSFLIMVGWFYRLAMGLFVLAFAYVFLLDQARYLNHFYLVVIFAFLMLLTPAARSYSLDAWVRARRGESQDFRVPLWSLWILRAQLELVLIYAGVVKINADWLRLEPLGMWLTRRDDLFLVGPLFHEDWVIALAAYGSIALHVLGAPLLLFKRTRLYVTLAYFAFHLANHFLFRIGIFPWFTMAATLLFFDPDWPRQVWRRVSRALGNFARMTGRPADV